MVGDANRRAARRAASSPRRRSRSWPSSNACARCRITTPSPGAAICRSGNAVEYTVGTYEEITPGIFHKLTGALTSQRPADSLGRDQHAGRRAGARPVLRARPATLPARRRRADRRSQRHARRCPQGRQRQAARRFASSGRSDRKRPRQTIAAPADARDDRQQHGRQVHDPRHLCLRPHGPARTPSPARCSSWACRSARPRSARTSTRSSTCSTSPISDRGQSHRRAPPRRDSPPATGIH